MISNPTSHSTKKHPSSPLPLPAGPPPGRNLWPADWGGIDASARRQFPRRMLHCPVKLVDLADDLPSGRVIPATCQDISDGGLYAILSIGYGVAVGQHYFFELLIDERGPEPGTVQLVQQWGEVLRTELLLNDAGETDRVGIAVRLYGHRVGTVPMPARA